MTKATTTNCKRSSQIPNTSANVPKKSLKFPKSPALPATQSERDRSNPEPDPTQQAANPVDEPKLRRSSRIDAETKKHAAKQTLHSEANTQETICERKRKRNPSAHARKHQTEPASGAISQPLQSISLTQQPHHRNASTQIPEVTNALPSNFNHQYRDAATQIPQVTKLLSSKINPWLDMLAPQEPPEQQPNLQQLYAMPESTRGQEPTPSTEADQTGFTGTSQRQTKTVNRRNAQLIAINVNLRPQAGKDDITIKLEQAMKQEKGLSEVALNALLAILTKCIEDSRRVGTDSGRYELFENFRHTLNQALPSHGLFTLTAQDFENDQMRCMGSPEAVLQRTILFDSTDRWRIEDHFAVGGEAPWKVAQEYRISEIMRATQQRVVTGPQNPKPDLAISFKFDKICPDLSKQAEIYPDIDVYLRTCVHPDGSILTCFPFLFVEAKKGDDSLDLAVLDGTWEAVQALQNIYSCMEKAGTIDDIEKVRVFSIGINAKNLEVRVHRARRGLTLDSLHFHSYSASPGLMPLRDSLNRVIRCILQEYATKTLLVVLQRTFDKLIHAASWKKLGRTRTLEIFGSDALDGVPDPRQVDERSKVTLSVDTGDLQSKSSVAQEQQKSKGRPPRAPRNQQGRANSKRPRPNAPASVNAEEGESLGVSQMHLSRGK